MDLLTFFIILVVVGAIFGGLLAMVATFMRKVDQGQALIVNKIGKEPAVTFTGMVVIPVLYRAEVMDISVKTIQLDRKGGDGLICMDNIRADIKVAFFVRVNKTVEDVLQVAQNIGVQRASDHDTLEELFVAKFSEALKTVGKQMDFEQLYTQRDIFKERILEVIGTDLNGYVLDDAAIDYLEQTPLESLDPANILDAQGIRKIRQITTVQNMHTDQLLQEERKTLTKQKVDADEAVLELERRRADAEAKQQREIETMKAREAAETAKIQAEERTRSRLAEIKEQEECEVADFNKQRQSEVADKDRERVLAIKTEQVEKDRQMERIAREREVELTRIAMEKDVEVQKKEIADVISTRIAVDKKVAEEEERIKDLRVKAEATRQADVIVINAEAEAQEGLVKEIKAAEAEEKVAEFQARKVLVEATASLEAADKRAQAKIRLAEGTQAQEAATGLAKVRVEEARAAAIEKTGQAEAKVLLEKMTAEASGRDALVVVKEKEGLTEAQVLREKLVAEAQGIESKGKAEAVGTEARLLAEATGVEKTGEAEAKAIGAKLLAEAEGLKEKLAAMERMEGSAKDHEEFRLRLENDRTIALEALDTQVKVAEQQAKLLGEAFESTDIKIMGGDGQFFDQFLKAASLGHAIDGFVDHSDAAKKVTEVVGRSASSLLGSDTLDSVSNTLKDFLSSASEADKAKLLKFLDRAQQLAGDTPEAK